ncbi:conjugal transfer protein TrbF [Sedimenticola hydrogenitrophicus]|uniref:conjugal transfer protein TrbF n=1 Tax=Sedimenticola hydrogenitrophicus TaxID=2967975 RepID=UPI0023B12C61|nr:conjugal transfer protein TrbF [Sedimenticola hydrogenitrophicus]
MSFSDTMKGIVFKKPADADPRRGEQAIAGGRRQGESENPYLSARRTWNDHVGAQVASRRMWQVVAILTLMIVLAAVGGIIHIGAQSKFIPYVIEVDKLGQAISAGPVTAASPVDQRVIHASVAEFITDARMVSPDVALQRRAIFRIYAKLAANDPATAKMNEWLNGSEDSSPFQRAAKVMVSTEITSAIPQSPDTWQVDWVETTRDRQGVAVGKPVNMRALITVYTTAPTPQTTEEQIRMNPTGIYVRNYSWSKLL